MRASAARITLFASLVLGAAWNANARAATVEALALDNPAPGVYVHYGEQAEMTPTNRGDIANVGFVVGNRCVAVIDTGGTRAVGDALRRAIGRVTPLPVCYVINTHVHPDHVFGNAAFVDDRTQFVGHARLADAMRRRGPNYLAALQRDLGAAAEGTSIILPTLAVASTTTLDLGGRSLELRAWPTAHTDCDLTIFDPAGRTLWLGDLAFVGHVPVVDGSLRGFLEVLKQVKTLDARVVIPGHGRVSGWPDAVGPEERYLSTLAEDVRAAIKARRTLAETLDAAPGDRAGWLLFDAFHKRNLSAAYAELEWEEPQ